MVRAIAPTGTRVQEQLDDDEPGFVTDARRMLTDLEMWEQRVGVAVISAEVSNTVTQCVSEVRKVRGRTFVSCSSTWFVRVLTCPCLPPDPEQQWELDIRRIETGRDRSDKRG